MTRRRALSACLLLILAGGLGVPSGASGASTRGFTWVLRPSPDLKALEVELTFQGLRPQRLVLALAEHGAALEAAPSAPGRYGLLATGDGFVPTLHGGQDPSAQRVRYRVDLTRLAGGGRSGAARPVGADLLVAPGAFLLAPAVWDAQDAAEVVWELPPGLTASVPWPQAAPGRHRLLPTSLKGDTRIALGRFSQRALSAAGALLEVVVLDGAHRATPQGIDRWLSTAFHTAAGLFGGRFPVPSVQVLVEPVGRSSEPVPFGVARLAGGASLHLLLAADAEDADLPGEWVAIHEALHLVMPWIDPADLWFSEGVATYYQELLRARAGFLSPQALFESLEAGFGRGRRQGTGRGLAEESRTMGQHHTYMRVYWGGAALALRLDLALRAASGGARSLDDLMRLWAEPSFGARIGWSGAELIRAGEARFGVRLWPLVSAALASSEFPSTDDLLAALGAQALEGRVALSDEGAGAATRRAWLSGAGLSGPGLHGGGHPGTGLPQTAPPADGPPRPAPGSR